MKKKAILSLFIVGIFWAIHILNIFLPLNSYGIHPRHLSGLPGILFAPFLHSGFAHLISNSIPFFVLFLTVEVFYERIAFVITILSAIAGGLLVWIFAREANHIGASGVIFSLLGFLLASGVFRKNMKAILIAVVIFFMYGGVLFGILPTQPGVSWEGHLFGLIAGIVLAYLYRKPDPASSIEEKGSS